MNITPIAYIKNSVNDDTDSKWENIESEIILTSRFDETAFKDIDQFSHLEIFFIFNKVKDKDICYGSRHPRNKAELPETGIFAQRGKDRPNRIGATIVNLLSHSGNKLIVKGLDALNGTPVIDIKPVMQEFLPQSDITQPQWTKIVMKDYWK
ncbi:SAM-dependent methyltransferase [soil metagenome]